MRFPVVNLGAIPTPHRNSFLGQVELGQVDVDPSWPESYQKQWKEEGKKLCDLIKDFAKACEEGDKAGWNAWGRSLMNNLVKASKTLGDSPYGIWFRTKKCRENLTDPCLAELRRFWMDAVAAFKKQQEPPLTPTPTTAAPTATPSAPTSMAPPPAAPPVLPPVATEAPVAQAIPEVTEPTPVIPPAPIATPVTAPAPVASLPGRSTEWAEQAVDIDTGEPVATGGLISRCPPGQIWDGTQCVPSPVATGGGLPGLPGLLDTGTIAAASAMLAPSALAPSVSLLGRRAFLGQVPLRSR